MHLNTSDLGFMVILKEKQYSEAVKLLRWRNADSVCRYRVFKCAFGEFLTRKKYN